MSIMETTCEECGRQIDLSNGMESTFNVDGKVVGWCCV